MTDIEGYRPASLRLGLSSGALYPHVLSEDVPGVAAGVGVTEIEMMLQTAGEYEDSVIQTLAANAGAAGVRVVSLHSWAELHPLFTAYPRRTAEAYAQFDRAIEAARELGAGTIVWHGPHAAAVPGPEGYERFLGVVAALAPRFAAAGVTLALENVSYCLLARVRDVAAFAARLPELGPPGSVGFAFDPFQAASAGANPFMMLAAMGEHVADVHLSDYRESDPGSRHLPPGEGDLPWSALLRAIAGVYRGPLIIEANVGADAAGLAPIRARLDPILARLASGDGGGPCAGEPPPGVLEGIALFNRGEFYACHEAIEHEWHAERGVIRALYQGILQIGVGFRHALGGNHRGAVLLLGDGVAKTSRFLPACLGIDTARLVRESQACLDRIVDLGPTGLHSFDPAGIPRVHLIQEDGRPHPHVG
jgi:sugar phosphate isomerase/epimerase